MQQLVPLRFVGYPIRIAQYTQSVLIQMGETLQQTLSSHNDAQHSQQQSRQNASEYQREEAAKEKERSGFQTCGLWLFQTRNTAVSASTAFLALSLLHRLIVAGFSPTGKEKLMCGVLLLISSKFNNIRQVRVKQLNRVLGSYLLEEYRVMEGDVLQALSYEVVQEQNIYIRLAKLHAQRQQQVEEITKMLIKQWPARQNQEEQEEQAGEAALSNEWRHNEESVERLLSELQAEVQ